MEGGAAGHWDAVHSERPHEAVSWFQREPATSLRLLSGVAGPASAVVDVGAGASRLPDALLRAGWSDVTLLDVSAAALEATRRRLGDRAARLSFVVADVLGWRPARTFDAWHDRAVFHFLVAPDARRRYVEVAAGAVRPGGAVVVATFAADGPTRCSGLPTARYDAEALAAEFGDAFAAERAEREEHVTPGGTMQPFTWLVLRRR